MTCAQTCHRPTASQAHCPTCHRTFGGVWGFDRHRRHGACLNPNPIGFEEINGIWRSPTDAARVAQLASLRVQSTEGRTGRTGTRVGPA
jgi:hypothetical protein